MAAPVFPQTVIAVIWDFDKTLIPDHMQKPLFEHFGVDPDAFWTEVNGLPDYYRRRGYPLVSPDTIYLNHLLSYVRAGRFEGLSNALLEELGSSIEFYPGLPEFFVSLKALVEDDERFERHGITLEHYIVSAGLRRMILGSAIQPYVDGVWGCEFLEESAPPGYRDASPPPVEPHARRIEDIGYVIDNTTKTRAVFEINKGANKDPERIKVDTAMAHEDRRVPFENMIYVADGPSDVPVFSVVNRYHGKTYAVYRAGERADLRKALLLQEQDRVQGVGPADYRPEGHTALHLSAWVHGIAERIVERREGALEDLTGKAPAHRDEQPLQTAGVPPATEAPQDEVAKGTITAPDPTRLSDGDGATA
jgi:hypothetical protein